MAGIVVGVDGSPNCEYALDWAMKQAAAVKAPLRVIAVHGVVSGYLHGGPLPYPEDAKDLEKTRRAAEELVQRSASRVGDARPASVTVRAVNGLPASELIDASADADLLVVGSRGGGGFSRLLLGSVSSQVIEHADCPVVVVPHKA
jgi:nucleotide-binding universal stress UspA family protein